MSASPATPLSPGQDPSPAQSSAGLMAFLSSLFWVYSPDGKSRRIFPGWKEVMAGTAHSFFGYGFYLYSWSAIVAAMGKEFGWSATMISVTGSMAREEGAIEGPVVGWLMDRVGPRVTSALGWLIAGTGFLILPLIYWLPRENNVWWMWLGYGAMVTIGANAALYNTSYKAINRWFIKNRALAIGMASWGSGFGSPILIPVTAYGVATYGWAPTVTAIGSLFIVMGMVSALLLFRRNGPEADGFFPDNEIPVIQAPKVTGEALAVPKVALKDYSALEALKDRSFWAWTGGGIIGAIGAATTALPIFQSIWMQEVGYTPQQAALWYALDFLFTIIGRVGISVIGDSFYPRIGYAASLVIEAIGFAAFAMLSKGSESNTLWLIMFVAFHGIGYGYSIPSAGVLPGALFGRERYGTIRGLNIAMVSVIGLPGPIFFGYLRDVTGGFYWPFLFAAVTLALGGLVILFARTPKGQLEPGRNVNIVAH